MKNYYVGGHLPAWMKNFFKFSVFAVKEEAWNAYPYTRTVYTSNLLQRLYIEIETKYLPDGGDTENAFQLSSSERKAVSVDLIDIVKDQLVMSDFVPEEDPQLYQSTKTGRGPLSSDWLVKAKKSQPIMCAYKLCRVQFGYWGIKSRTEKFIHDSGE